MAKKPQSESQYLCPLFKEKQEEVCHKCAFYTHIRGANPNDGKEVDHWACTIEFLPMLLIETAQQSRQTGSAVESFRNEMVKAHEANINTMVALATTKSEIPMRIIHDAPDNR